MKIRKFFLRTEKIIVAIYRKNSKMDGMTATQSIKPEIQGRRVYLFGNTFGIKDAIKAAGGKWDPDQRAWWISTTKANDPDFQRLINDANSGASAPAQGQGQAAQGQGQYQAEQTKGTETKVIGKALYKGKSYYVVFFGRTSRGNEAFKLSFRDGSKYFWADATEATWEKHYSERQDGFGRYARRSYPTIESLQAYAQRQRDPRTADNGFRANGCSECKRLGDYCRQCAFDEFDN